MSENKIQHPAPLNTAYKETIFEFAADVRPSDFWLITAYNPDGKNTDEISNHLADEKLHAELVALGVEPFRVTGLSPDRTHAEPGWGAALDEETAMNFGRKFRQDAIFHFQEGEIWLVNCMDGSSEALDHSVRRF